MVKWKNKKWANEKIENITGTNIEYRKNKNPIGIHNSDQKTTFGWA